MFMLHKSILGWGCLGGFRGRAGLGQRTHVRVGFRLGVWEEGGVNERHFFICLLERGRKVATTF